MYIPIPIIIVLGLTFLLMVGQTIRSSRKRDPLLGDRAPAFRPAVAPHQERAPIMPVATLSAETESQVRALIAAGRKIEAVKLTRDATHLGLKESKDLVEALERSPRLD
jgi:large subunit ribosomal protein L7/L12